MAVPTTQKPLKHFPDRPQFSGFMKPCRMEGEVENLEIYGDVPEDIYGMFYRVMPDPQFSPFIVDDPAGYGSMAMATLAPLQLRMAVSFKQRYVRTEKFTREREAQRALLGKVPIMHNHFHGGEQSLPMSRYWFRYPNSFPGHTANAYEDESGKLILDLTLSDKNVFFWWPDAQGNAPEPNSIQSQLTRFTIDPLSSDVNLSNPTILQNGNSEFYRIDDRFVTQPYRHCFFDLMDPLLGTDFPAIAPQLGGGYPLYNSLAHLDIDTDKTEVYFLGKTHMVQEPVFIPRRGSATEGDGYVVALVNNYASMCSELHLLDTRDFTKFQAVVLLPVRLRQGLHGNWVDSQHMQPKA